MPDDLDSLGNLNITVEGRDNSNFYLVEEIKNLMIEVEKDTVISEDESLSYTKDKVTLVGHGKLLE